MVPKSKNNFSLQGKALAIFSVLLNSAVQIDILFFVDIEVKRVFEKCYVEDPYKMLVGSQKRTTVYAVLTHSILKLIVNNVLNYLYHLVITPKSSTCVTAIITILIRMVAYSVGYVNVTNILSTPA